MIKTLKKLGLLVVDGVPYLQLEDTEGSMYFLPLNVIQDKDRETIYEIRQPAEEEGFVKASLVFTPGGPVRMGKVAIPKISSGDKTVITFGLINMGVKPSDAKTGEYKGLQGTLTEFVVDEARNPISISTAG